MPLSNLPTGTVSPGDSRGTRPRDGDTPHADRSASAGADTDRDLYVAELEHENAALRAELERRADRDAQGREQCEHAVTTHDQSTQQSDTDVPDDSLRLRLARLLRLR